MKIAYLTSEYPSPSHTFIRREIDALREEGAEIEVFAIHRPHDGARLSREDRSAYDETRYVLGAPWVMALEVAWAFARGPLRSLRTLAFAFRHRVPGLRAALWALFYFAEAVRLARLLARSGVAHLHNHFANPSAIVGMLAARHVGVGFSLTIHGISEFDGPAGSLLPEKVRACRFVACVSSFGRAQVMRLVHPCEWPKLFVSRCGLRVRERPRRVEREGRLRFFSVGRLSPEKGQAGLLVALRATLDSGVDCELLLVGDGSLRATLEEMAVELGVAQRVVFHGQFTDDEVAAAMADADVFVLSSLMEGLPVVIMEALAAGVPVIAPGVAGIPELVVHGETGLLFPPSDWEALADQMTSLALDPGRRQRLGERGRRSVAAQHEIATAIRPLFRRFAALELVPRPELAEETRPQLRIDVDSIEGAGLSSPEPARRSS